MVIASMVCLQDQVECIQDVVVPGRYPFQYVFRRMGESVASRDGSDLRHTRFPGREVAAQWPTSTDSLEGCHRFVWFCVDSVKILCYALPVLV